MERIRGQTIGDCQEVFISVDSCKLNSGIHGKRDAEDYNVTVTVKTTLFSCRKGIKILKTIRNKGDFSYE